MAPSQVSYPLASIPLFHGLDEAQLTRLNALLHRKRFVKDSTIITAEQPGEVAYVILDGTVKVHSEQADGSDVIIAIRGPGEVVGELSLIDNARRSANVVTLEETTVLWIDRVDFQACLRTMLPLTYNLLQVFAKRLRLAQAQIEALAVQNLYGRVARQLLALADAYGAMLPNGNIVIPLRIKQSDLASMVGASRSRVNQVLSFYRERSYISIDPHGRITIHNTELLAKRCH